LLRSVWSIVLKPLASTYNGMYQHPNCVYLSLKTALAPE
jgi:hypothetical protein